MKFLVWCLDKFADFLEFIFPEEDDGDEYCASTFDNLSDDDLETLYDYYFEEMEADMEDEVILKGGDRWAPSLTSDAEIEYWNEIFRNAKKDK